MTVILFIAHFSLICMIEICPQPRQRSATLLTLAYACLRPLLARSDTFATMSAATGSKAVRKRRTARPKQCSKCLEWFKGTGHASHENNCDGTPKGKGLSDHEALQSSRCTSEAEHEDEPSLLDTAASPPKRPAATQQITNNICLAAANNCMCLS